MVIFDRLSCCTICSSRLIYSACFCLVCPQEGALTAFRKTYDKTVALGHRLDIVFYLLRIGLFYMDSDLITRNSEKAKR